MAGKTNDSPSDIDKTTFLWVQNCSICHPGGGAGEYDRNGELLYDLAADTFGYENLGQSPEDVALDGDYAFLNPGTGGVSPAAWDVTGLSEPDCLLCHRLERSVGGEGQNMNWIWRTGTLRGGAALVDDAGESVPAFAAASTAGQGWFSTFTMAELPPGNPPKATALQIDYTVGVGNGSLSESMDGHYTLAGTSITKAPPDYSCWGCHAIADQKKRGRVWFDPDQDVHYAAFNNLNDDDTSNDIPPTASTACTYCHPTDIDHSFRKGNAFLSSVEDETDYVEFRTCRDCHLADSPERDPNAPAPTAAIHTSGHLAAMACQFCHIPFKQNPAQLIVDNATTGASIAYNTDQFYSADPLDPTDPDKSRWWPASRLKVDQDDTQRLYPNKLLLSSWWGDWDQNGTPEDFSDDIVQPIILWRARQITGGAPLEGVTDDNGDGQPEVNTLAEIALYITALKGNDSHGNPVASVPVLVKGDRVYYEDAGAPGGVNNFHVEEEGCNAESLHPFSADHNVLLPPVALGATGCGECHISMNNNEPTPVFDRLILIDPFDTNGDPIYETMRELTGVDPF